ncbi:response regulator [Cohnella abietis]|uniref:DNA-binding response regulator n=1 Tax=Cohnella abietis TaxID=2507935 RepID=A0A3T1DED8_9BACL|nr:response regulator [Cohnella abietis]BBI36462.1 DNA-binding response regulator [Cohnella abietis]
MKVIIMDDENAMHLIMRRMLAKIVGVEIVGSFHETTSAMTFLDEHEVDLAFLDISMPRENGIDFARRLRENGKQTKLVFVTSHKEYALSAFDVYAFDYILKPVEQARIHKTVQRAQLSVKPTEMVLVEKASSSTVHDVIINCLGGVEIRSERAAVAKWNSKKSAELFGYLLIHQGRLVSRARLIEDIFAGMPQKNAEIYLNTTVYKIRKILEMYGLKESLYSDSNHYALNLNDANVDIISFEEGYRNMDAIDDTNIEEAIKLEQLYKGDLFGDRAFPWAWSEVERFSLMYTSLTQQLCSALLNRGDTSGAILLLLRLIARNELDEQSIELLMMAYAAQKNKEALTQLYMRFTETLHQEMGVSPSFATTTLYRELLTELDS